MQLIQDKSKESCMVSFQQLHSHLKCLSNNDLKETQIEYGFKRAFATLFGQDLETFTGTMFLYMDQLQKQLDNEEFQEIVILCLAFKVPRHSYSAALIHSHGFIWIENNFDMTLQHNSSNTSSTTNPEFRDTLIQHMESVKKSIGERAQHKMEYESRVNERQIHNKKRLKREMALDALDARQQHTEQPEFINEGEVDQNAEQCHEICPLPAKLTDDKTTELSNQLLESENVCLKKTVAQCQKDFAKL
ncbi:hypothetical protein Tco_0837008 [Tanacetum coccineum]